MKIVHICLGGGWYEKNAYQDQLLPHYHRLLGHDVTIIASQYGRWNLEKNCYDMDTIPSRILDDGIKLIRIKPALPLKINTHIHLYCGLKSVLQNETPDLIFAHGVETINYLCLVKYKRNHPEVKIVCDNHGDRINSLHHWSTRLWSKYVIKGIIVRRLMPVTEWFYGTTPSRCDFLKDAYGVPKERIKLLMMGADDEKMHLDQRENIRIIKRKEIGVTDQDFVLVTGGRFSKSKGTRLVELVKAVSSSNTNTLKLVVFGPISDDVGLLIEPHLNDKIFLIGGIPSDTVYEFFYAADLVVFNGLHSVMWEQAVASRVPCLFSRIEGFEHVDFGGNCVLMDGDDADYYRKLFESVYFDRSGYEIMLNKANSEESHQFLYSKVAENVIRDCFQ